MRALIVALAALLLALPASAQSVGRVGRHSQLLRSIGVPVYTWDFVKNPGTYPPTSWAAAPTGGASGTYFSSTGVLTVGSGAPRYDYDPLTLLPLGVLVEQQAINIVLWNRDLTNAAWVISNSTDLTTALDQTGLDQAGNSASSILANVGGGTVCQTVTLASSTRAQSVYVQRLIGTGAVSMATDGATYGTISCGAGWLDSGGTCHTQSTWFRVTIPAQATVTNPQICFKLAAAGDKIAVDAVQNETGGVTSPILTTTAAVTRTSDNLRLDIAATLALFNTGTMSGIIEVGQTSTIGVGYRLIGWSAAGGAAGIQCPASGAGVKPGLYNDSINLSLAATNIVPTLREPNLNPIFRVGFSYKPGSRTLVMNGGSLVIDGLAIGGNLPITHLTLGSNNGNSNGMNGHIRSVAFYAVPLYGDNLKIRTQIGAPYQ